MEDESKSQKRQWTAEFSIIWVKDEDLSQRKGLEIEMRNWYDGFLDLNHKDIKSEVFRLL